MAFEGLQEKLSLVFRRLKGRGRLTEGDINTAMREIRVALLDADVNAKVVREFIDSVSKRAVGSDVLESLTPAQQVIKIVNEELSILMGGANEKLNIAYKGSTVIMMVGLQGAGKTTNAAKLAAYIKKTLGRRPLLVACDVYRPAAIEQLKIVGAQVGVPVFEFGTGNPVEIAKRAVTHAADHGNDVIIIDTAGRLHVDEVLMEELKRIKAAVQPSEIMLVVDAMTGQDAVNVAEAFDAALGITGVLLAKSDSDARGGAALSVKASTGKPIKFVGVGEKIEASGIEPFYPDRMASRILGMGDMLSLIEKAQSEFDEKKASELEKKIKENRMTLDDFLDQMRQIKKMGSIQSLLGMIPGVKAEQLQNAKIDEKQLARTEAIILSMTKQEREYPDMLNFSRKKRIAAGSGTRIEDINRLLKQFDATLQLTKQTSRGKPPQALVNQNNKNKPVKGFRYPFR